MCLALGAAAATGVSYWHFVHTPSQIAGTPHITPETLSKRRVIHGVGYVEPAAEVRKLMLRTGGVVRRCYVKVGDKVKKGEKILELDSDTQKAELMVARKSLELVKAEAEHVKAGINPYQIKAVEHSLERLQEKLRHAQSEIERSRRLIQTRSTSPEEHEAKETRLRQALVELKDKQAELVYLNKYVTPEHRAMMDAKVQHAQSAFELAEERFRETVLLAPFDGVILKVLKREGEGVRMFEPEPVVLFGDLSKLTVRAEIDERFVSSIVVGQNAVVFGRNVGSREYRGTAAVIEPIMGDKTLFARVSSEKRDLDVLQVVIEMEDGFRAPVGLQVDVRFQSGPPAPINR